VLPAIPTFLRTGGFPA